jgi:hypothetical protein
VSAVAQFARPQYQLTTTAISSLTNEARVVLRKRAQRRQLPQSDSTFSYLLLLHHHPLVLEIDKSFSPHSLMQIKIGRKPHVADHFRRTLAAFFSAAFVARVNTAGRKAR